MHKVLSVAEFASAIFSPHQWNQWVWSWNSSTGIGEKAESGAVGKLQLSRWTGEGEAVVSFVDPELGTAP